MRLALSLLRGLAAQKRPFLWLVWQLRVPFAILFRWVLLPLLVVIYRFYLACRRVFETVAEFVGDRTVGFFTSKHVVQAVAIILTFLVTTTNLYASDGSSPLESARRHSIFADISGAEDELLVEENQADAAVGDVDSYLANQAIAPHHISNTESSLEDEAITEEELEDVDPILNAVRPQQDTGDLNRPPTRTAVVVYMVQAGDTVASIADKFGLKQSTVITANNLGSRAFIREGQPLRILPVDGIAYTVKKGDTVEKIAKKYSSEVARISDINWLDDGGRLTIGVELVLPDGKLPAPPPPPVRVANIKDIFVPPSYKQVTGGGTLLWPTAVRRITQYFKRSHNGVDIAGPVGTPIYAADDGAVIFSGWNRGGYGNMMLLDHGNGMFTRYAHGSKLLYKVGAQVKKGDTIMLMGSTGRSTGPHLHFEVMLKTVRNRANPFSYVK